MDNDIQRIVRAVRGSNEQSPGPIFIGRVTSPEPLNVKLQGIVLKEKQLYVNKSLFFEGGEKVCCAQMGDMFVVLCEVKE